jgi:hypothetical protein
MSRTVGGGNRGARMKLECVPDSDFKDEIDALITAGTEVVGKFVSLTWGANYEVTSPANDAIPDGIIVDYEKEKSSYVLICEIWKYTDQNGNSHTPVMIQNLYYNTGTIALQDSVIVNGTTYYIVDDGGTGGWGAVIAKDVPSKYVDVIF